MKRRRLAVLIVATCVAGGTTGAVLALTGTSGAGAPYDATSPFSLFRTTPAVQPPAQLASARILSKTADFSKTHEPARSLGRFSSSLLVFPANGGQNVCYALIGSALEDPAMSYCFSPADPAVQAGQHFNGAALQSYTDGAYSVQVFGVAWDDVTHLRLQVDGGWKPVPIVRNGFYIDVPGATLQQVGNLEATLRDGSVQLHNVRTGSNG